MRKTGVVILICLLIYWVSTEFLYQKFGRQDSMVAATVEKQKMLREVPSPRLIFTGGSSLSFGLNSDTISKLTGYNVVNMGMMGGLGLDYLLNETIDGVREGDKIILCTEYYMSRPALKLLALVALDNPDGKKYIRLGLADQIRLRIIMFQVSIKNYFWQILKVPQDPIYRRSGFNKYGDLISHLDVKNQNMEPLNTVFISGDLDYSDELIVINEFIKKARIKGAEVWFSFQTASESEYNMNDKAISFYEKQISEGIDCKLINNSKTFVMPDSLFLGPSHLNRYGRPSYSKAMADLINEHVR